ncbi:MAG: 30S ribosomal protein S4 [bacterium]
MARYTGPACRVCRREGVKLFLKGERCFMAKCPMEDSPTPPGMHGATKKRKVSDYGKQLSEKQRLRKSYGLQETPFRLLFKRASKKHGVTGEILLQMLEMRLDNLVYRLGFAPSRRAARQFVRHNHVLVNGGRADIPSMVLKAGDSVSVKSDAGSRDYAKQCVEKTVNREPVSWLSVDKDNLLGNVIRVPSRDEIAPTVNEQLIVELYSK